MKSGKAMKVESRKMNCSGENDREEVIAQRSTFNVQLSTFYLPPSTFHSHRQRRSGGFTLIEVMVVMAIIGLFAMMVVMTVPTGGGNSSEQAAQTLHNRLQYAREFAMVRQATLGLRVDQDRYQFVSWQSDIGENGRWQLISHRGLNEQRLDWPLAIRLENAELELLQQEEQLSGDLLAPADDRDEDGNEPVPQLIIFPSGEFPQFSIQIEDTDDINTRWVIQSTDGSHLQVKPHE